MNKRAIVIGLVVAGALLTVPHALGTGGDGDVGHAALAATNSPTLAAPTAEHTPQVPPVEAPTAGATEAVPPPPSNGPACTPVAAGHDMGLALSDAPRCALQLFDASLGKIERPAADGRMAPGALRQRVPEIDAVYMVHYTGAGIAGGQQRASAMDQAKVRRSAMGRVFANHSVAIDAWVTALDREDLSKDDISCLHRRWEPAEYRLPNKGKRHETQRHEPLKPTQVSVNAKHHLAMYDVVSKGHGLALIVEDDVLFHACFADHLRSLLDSLVPNATAIATGDAPAVCGSGASKGPARSLGFDVLWIGGCMNMHAYRKKRKMAAPQLNAHAYLKTEARCAHAYLVTNRAAALLLQSMPLTLPIDFQITSAMRERGLRSVWAEPWLSIQGGFGSCVTNQLGAKCFNEKYTREFDENFATDRAECAKYHAVPKAGTVK